jgi:alanyl-tRNA synthetase
MHFPGSRLFELKDTHGLSLENALDQLQARGVEVEWPSFVEAARKAGWYDFKTIDAIEFAMADAGATRSYQDGVKIRLRQYVLEHPLAA